MSGTRKIMIEVEVSEGVARDAFDAAAAGANVTMTFGTRVVVARVESVADVSDDVEGRTHLTY